MVGDRTWVNKGTLSQTQVIIASERSKRKIIPPKHLENYVK